MTARPPVLLPPTARQLQVLAAYCRTGSMKEAAADLGISDHTVKDHLWGLYSKVGASNHIETLMAIGWLVVPDNDDVVRLGNLLDARRDLEQSIGRAQRLLEEAAA